MTSSGSSWTAVQHLTVLESLVYHKFEFVVSPTQCDVRTITHFLSTMNKKIERRIFHSEEKRQKPCLFICELIRQLCLVWERIASYQGFHNKAKKSLNFCGMQLCTIVLCGYSIHVYFDVMDSPYFRCKYGKCHGCISSLGRGLATPENDKSSINNEAYVPRRHHDGTQTT